MCPFLPLIMGLTYDLEYWSNQDQRGTNLAEQTKVDIHAGCYNGYTWRLQILTVYSNFLKLIDRSLDLWNTDVIKQILDFGQIVLLFKDLHYKLYISWFYFVYKYY